MALLDDIISGSGQILGGLADGASGVANALFPEQIERIRENELRKKIDPLKLQRAELELANSQIANTEAVRKQKDAELRRSVNQAVQKMYMGDVLGKDDIYNQGEAELAKIFPGVSVGDGVINTADGPMPLSNDRKSRKERLERALKYTKEPAELYKDLSEAQEALDKKNKGAAYYAVDEKGTMARQQWDDDGNQFFEIRKPNGTVTRSATPPMGLEVTREGEKHKLNLRKGEADIEQSKASAAHSRASAEKTREESEQVRTQQFEQYISNGSDGMPIGTVMQRDLKTGKVSPVSGQHVKDDSKILDDLNKTHGIRINDKNDNGEFIYNDESVATSAEETLKKQGYTGKWMKSKDGGWRLNGVEKISNATTTKKEKPKDAATPKRLPGETIQQFLARTKKTL